MREILKLKRGYVKKSLHIREYMSKNGYTKIVVIRGGPGRQWIIQNSTQQYLYGIEISEFYSEKRKLFSLDNEMAVKELLEDKKVMEDAFEHLYIERKELEMEVHRYSYALDAIREALESGGDLSVDYTLAHILEPVKQLQKRAAIEAQEEYRTEKARKAAMARHSAPDGSHSKRDRLREVWASGKYSSRDLCADQEYENLGVSYATARRYLYGTPEPS